MKIQDIKIIFLGTSHFAEEILRLLLKNGINISYAVTQPDKPAGRKKTLLSSEVKKLSLKRNIPLKQFGKINNEALDFFRAEKPGLVIVAAYGVILPKSLLDVPQFGCINFHASLLPEFRGSSPIQAAILQDKKISGITLMEMDEKVDHGKIISQKKVSIEPDDDYYSLEKKLLLASEKMIPDILENYVNKKITPKEQKHKNATFAKIIKKQDGQIDWNSTAWEIYNKYRAFKKWPGIFSFWNEKKISLPEIEILRKDSKHLPGSVFKENNTVAVQTKKDSLIIKKIQMEGKKPLAIEAFLNGHPAFVKSKLA